MNKCKLPLRNYAFQDLFCRIPKKQYAHRNIAGMDFELGNGLKISVGMFVFAHIRLNFSIFMIIFLIKSHDALSRTEILQLLFATPREDPSTCDSEC